VIPRRAQVVPGRARKLWPVSSQRRSVRFSRCAFFERYPVPLGPDGDDKLIALSCSGGGALHAEAMRPEGSLQITRMVAHSERALDQGRDTLEGPALGGKARRHGAPVQQPTQTGPGLLIEPRVPTRNGASLQAMHALLGEGCGPAADTGAADPKFAGDLGLGEPPLAQQPRACQTPLLHLLGCQMRRPPHVVIHRAPPHEDRHRPMLHHLREDH
jgi:hypothetical protein